MRRPVVGVALAAGCAFALFTHTVAAQRPPLPVRGFSAPVPLARIYDAIFDARLDDAAAMLRSACEPARPGMGDERVPPEACQVMNTLAGWERIRLDTFDLSHDREFSAGVERAIAGAEAWTSRDPTRAEAWFYLGAGYGARAQWRSTRGQSLSAARDGKHIKDALERALTLDPSMQDARVGIGLYQYYADVAPAALRALRWLLLLPGGDRVGGLRTMEQARTRAQLVRSEAEYQLHLVYLWYEHAPERALELVRGLRARHPRNPHFAEVEADIHDVHRSDISTALRTWRAMFDAASTGGMEAAAMATARARLGMAVQLDRLGESDAAADQLRALVAIKPRAPAGIMARAHLELGRALDRLGSRTEALEQYAAALTTLPPGDPYRTAAGVREARRVPPDARTAQAYRASLDGWRAFERGALADAAKAFARSTALRPADPSTRYRMARLHLAERRTQEAVAALENIISDPATPPHVFVDACWTAARALEQNGAVERAIELYRLVVDAFGVDPTRKSDAQRAVARLSA